MFQYGNPVPPELFIGRRRELRRIASRLEGGGQSVVVVGEPRTGKTSLLAYLASPGGLDLVAGRARIVSSYLDAHAFSERVGHVQFWERALAPLASVVDGVALRECHAAAFEPYALEALLNHLREAEVRLVLLIDELDHLVCGRVADPAGFFGTLRSLTSRYGKALAVVGASRLSKGTLDAEAQRRGFTGSPPFNHMSEEPLGPLAPKEVDALLDRGRDALSEEDRRYVHELAGGHAYLVQAAAGTLLDAALDDHRGPRERRAAAAAALRRCAGDVIADIWHHWPAERRLVFAAIAVEHLDAVSGAVGLPRGRRPGEPGPIADIASFDDALEKLDAQGFITADPITPSQRRVRPIAFLSWCAREMRKTSATPAGWEAWLGAQGWDALLSSEQRRTWIDRVRPGLRRAPVDLDLLGGAPARVSSRPDLPPESRVGTPVQVHLSHAGSPGDDPLVAELQKHLAALRREGRIALLAPQGFGTGRAVADERLHAADVILLCVSADYVDYDRCNDVDVALALQRYRLGEARVIPVLLRPVDWERLPFGKLPSLPRNGRAVTSWDDEAAAWLDVAQGIRAVVQDIRDQRCG